MTSVEEPRNRAASHGTFLSLPAVFEGASDGLRHAFKMEIAPVVRASAGSGRTSTVTFGTTFLTDRALVDLGAVEPAEVDLDRVLRDCELIKAAIRDHPDVVQRAIASVAGAGQDAEAIAAAAEELERIGLTEQHALHAGGGLIGLLVLACVLALCAGCATCAHGSQGHRPPEVPHTIADAGPG